VEVYLIRHAQSYNNVVDPLNRVFEPYITDLGIIQSKALSTYLLKTHLTKRPSEADSQNLSGYYISRLYCSPMQRALQTAGFLSQSLHLTPIVWTDLHEQGGVYMANSAVNYPGRTRAEICSEFPKFVLPETITEHGWWNKEYEVVEQFYERTWRVVHELRALSVSCADDGIALVSHSGVFDALIKALTGTLSLENPIYYDTYNTSISRIDFGSNGKTMIRYLNRITHLELSNLA
jgi:broad specificity phosphatase PhoE